MLLALYLTLYKILDIAKFSINLLSLFRRYLLDKIFINISISR